MEKSESSTGLKYYSEPGIDRITSLPEALHSKILSFLPTKDAIATSILSKRWKFVWTCINNLSFTDDSSFYYNKFRHKDIVIIREKKFIQFINTVLLRLNPQCIQNFYLRYRQELSDPLNLQPWVCAAIERTIQKLELWLVLAEPIELPLSHFSCKTLTVLKLSKDIHFNLGALASVCFPNLLALHLYEITFTIASNCSVSFPSLKYLHLDYVKYANQESVNKLFASCPVLDRLEIRRDVSDNVICLIISIPSLKRLSIKCFDWYYTYLEYKFHIDTPALEYLDLYTQTFFEYTLESLSCLLKVTVQFTFDEPSHYVRSDNHMKKTKENILRFLRGLVNVRFLSISGSMLKAVGSLSENIAPVFSNLTRLEIDRHDSRDWYFFIANLLERMNNLEHLTLKGFCWHSYESWWIEPLSVPMCLQRRVTTISYTSICNFCSRELGMVGYFLKNAEVLELMTVDNISSSSEDNSQLMQKISMIPRGSRACQIKFR